MHLRFEIPDFQRVSFRTELQAYARTSTTPQISDFVFLLPDRLDIHTTKKMRIAHAASHLLHRLLTTIHVCQF